MRIRANRSQGCYTFARVGAAVALKVEDFYIQKRRGWVRLHEKGGKVNELPCHHNLEQLLDEWLNASGLAGQPSAPLFPTMRHGKLTGREPQANVHMMIQRRPLAAGLRSKVSAHSFRAIGIATYLQNGGKLEVAQQMAGHESARTTGLYDRRNDSVALDDVERIALLTGSQGSESDLTVAPVSPVANLRPALLAALVQSWADSGLAPH